MLTHCPNYITKENNTRIQFIEANNHRVNAAERAIQTFKNHFVAGLCTVHKNFPMQLWCELLQQCELTLNLLRASRKNNKLSAYAQLEGGFNFNHTPLAPPGTKASVYMDNKIRNSWAPHAKDAWYVGPTLHHYRCYRFYLPETRAIRIAQTAKFFPTCTRMPAITQQDKIS